MSSSNPAAEELRSVFWGPGQISASTSCVLRHAGCGLRSRCIYEQQDAWKAADGTGVTPGTGVDIQRGGERGLPPGAPRRDRFRHRSRRLPDRVRQLRSAAGLRDPQRPEDGWDPRREGINHPRGRGRGADHCHRGGRVSPPGEEADIDGGLTDARIARRSRPVAEKPPTSRAARARAASDARDRGRRP
ncbi:hypothetical protein SKAU_G00070810 [Synaphobranchus kaupii]|uniref:Uncharacterized protein n=1 Tax=Synaphobranchus kaupii TaxID=118154 RepID=A0A9Q1JAH9_SYNKA|nr:hypothetical protein SKAU_G00070810 [Synaphobranchus kaupii]